EAHKFSNATTADLWQALEAATGKKVAPIAASFTEQDGVPLVIAETACEGAAQKLSLRQDRFAVVPAAANETLPPRHWQVPVEALDAKDQRAVWDQVINAFTQLDRLSRDRAERPALEAYMRGKLRPVFDRVGWDGSGSGDDDDTLLRSSLIRALGEFGDADVL